MEYQTTRQGVRDLNNPIRPHRPGFKPIRPRQSGVNVGSGERALSTLGGAVIAGFALGKGGFWEILLGAAAGTALAYRGLTGHCSGYSAAGINHANRR